MSSIYSESLTSRDNAIDRLKSAARAVGLTPARIQELGLDQALDATPVVNMFLKGVEPADRVRVIHAKAEAIRAEFGPGAKGQVITSSQLDESSLRELADVLSV